MNTQNKTKEVKADWEEESENLFAHVFDEIFKIVNGRKKDWTKIPFFLFKMRELRIEFKDHIRKNFVAKGEVREMIEDIQATEIADHSLASLIEKLYKYKKSLE